MLFVSLKKTLICLVAALGILGASCGQEHRTDPTAPDFALPDLSGETRRLSDYTGNVVLLDFWATWCPPCRMSIPELIKLQNDYRDRGLVIIGVSLDDHRQVPNAYLKAFREKFNINYEILRYDNRILGDYFGAQAPAIPTMFVIDREMKIREKVVGFDPHAVRKAVQGLLG
ncbi:MAG: TlpA family protein disulfide reductase [Deltaproteobacteria bacterium]|nr:TlpA family protein disulfide reductase [Deltaproteobacteria bacterium]MBW1949104.1 TlpA family protein disulfide reductase [Deltaproteobacteria bacterium]MBW2008598.1 TlpA family protein disulfide reductase [Deltaproteobacteria bacterium]MBW2347842.1 TlpA family protein disulfide reductase [Deltaproteobacteria bacterium]